jgi:GxxExxY protein
LESAYRGVRIGNYRLDLMVADLVGVEIKSVDDVRPVHVAQMLTYLRASGKQVGLVINFNVACLRHGVKRVIVGDPRNSARLMP